MDIYIEEFLIQNVIINFCLLRLVYLTLKPKTRFVNLMLSSIVGGSFSVISAICLTDKLSMNILKLLCSIFMILIAFRQSKKQFIYSYILLFLYTYALGGAMTSLGSHHQYTSFGVITYSEINMYLVCLGIIAITYIFELIVKTIKFRFKSNTFIYQITLKHNNRKLSINAYMDTGNLLNLEGKPIIIVDLDIYLKLTNTNMIDFYLNKTNNITAGTVTGNNNLKIFTIDEITINLGKQTIVHKNQLIAVNTTSNFKNTNYQALLSPMIL